MFKIFHLICHLVHFVVLWILWPVSKY